MERALGYQRKAYKKSRKEKPWRILVDSAKLRAKKKNVPCSIDGAWAEARWNGYCELTGIPFATSGARSPYSPSIDRRDPKLGYTKENCRFVLWAINAFKTDGTDTQMLEIARALLAHIPPA